MIGCRKTVRNFPPTHRLADWVIRTVLKVDFFLGSVAEVKVVQPTPELVRPPQYISKPYA